MPEVSPTPKQTSSVAFSGVADVGRALRERWVLVLVCLVAAALGAGILSALTKPTYTATAEVLFRDPGLDDKVFGNITTTGPRDFAREAETNTRLATLDIINEKAAKALGGKTTDGDIERSVTIESDPKSDVVAIEATDADPARAAKIANTFANEFIEFRRAADTEAILRTQRLIDEQIAALSSSAASGADGQRLKEQADRLRMLASLQTGNAELVQPARPPKDPSAPQPVRNVLLGMFLGLVLGVASALVAHRLDDRVKTPQDLEKLAGLPVLAKIGKLPDPGSSTPGAGAGGVLEAFSFLVARLRYFNVDREVKVMLITSPEPEAGKSTLSWYLAAAACGPGNARVLLLEADLRRPVLAQRHGLGGGPGLAELLSTPSLSLDDVVRRGDPAQGRGFDVLPAGSPPPNPIELLQSNRFTNLLEEARKTYDLVCVDTAPIGLVADAISLMRNVDGVLLVARMNQTKRSHFVDTVAEFERSGASALGVVANGVTSSGPGYGYSYLYDSSSPSEHSRTGSPA